MFLSILFCHNHIRAVLTSAKRTVVCVLNRNAIAVKMEHQLLRQTGLCPAEVHRKGVLFCPGTVTNKQLRLIFRLADQICKTAAICGDSNGLCAIWAIYIPYTSITVERERKIRYWTDGFS